MESITQYLWSEFGGIAHLAMKILMTSIEYASLPWQLFTDAVTTHSALLTLYCVMVTHISH